ncbi:hypothetical protein [Corynebacterium renale]|uniref:Uncharacterized protein n=1 Tax=Corynebacterium renale TaxID=1724 RepID=A0A2A9DPE6_9CORY|nr:hypothetical protein [Corynebacterium renale]PFG28453.1 hypothetical protein ATK06_1564 [Corynebacterium renale]SQI26381.1 hypothetical membrane protein [Corynebacterium renale]
MEFFATVAQEAPNAEPNRWLVYALFAVGGLLIGGAWSAYQAESKLWTVIAGVLGVMAALGGVLWMVGGLT